MPYRDDHPSYEVLRAAVEVAKRREADVDDSLRYLSIYVTEKSAPRHELDASMSEVRAALRQVEEQLVVARRAAESLNLDDPNVRSQLSAIESVHQTMTRILGAAEERFG